MNFITQQLNRLIINILMNNFRRTQRSKNERSSFAVQSDPNDLAQLNADPNSTEYNVKIVTSKTSQSQFADAKGSGNNVEIIQDPEKEQKIEGQSNKFKPFRARKNQLPKAMKLQNASIDMDKNVYSLAINDYSNGQSYLSILHEELSTLRDRIRFLEDQQNGNNFKRTIGYDQQPSSFIANNSSEDRSRTIQTRRSMCGRFYSRGQGREVGLSSDRRSSRYSNRQSEQTWKPKQRQYPTSEFDSFAKDANGSSEFQNVAKKSSRPNSNYRVKHNSKKNGENYGKNEVGKFRPASRSSSLRKNQEQKEELPKEIPEQLKPVFISNPQWAIKSINDDFRDKIMKKLQIPQDFPINIPEATDQIEEYYRISQQIYSVFNVDIEKCKEKLVVRRFKNGVYFQLKPNKNIVWYFHGTFYFGDWETDLPSEGDKNGFGFQYVPKKYFYLGHFKDGMRHGKGTIKIINVDQPNPDCFTCYDGEWIQGKPYGYGAQIDQKGNKYMGNFENGDKTGSAIILNRDGLYYEGKVKCGLKHGYGVQKLVNGDIYMGQFVEGKFEGHGVYKWKNGSTYEGQFVRGKREGRGKWKSYNGDEFDGDYVNDIKHGWGKFTWGNGEMYEGEFRNDIRHGPGTYKHPSGKMGKFMWIDGQIDHRLYTKEEEEYRCRNFRRDGKQ